MPSPGRQQHEDSWGADKSGSWSVVGIQLYSLFENLLITYLKFICINAQVSTISWFKNIQMEIKKKQVFQIGGILLWDSSWISQCSGTLSAIMLTQPWQGLNDEHIEIYLEKLSSLDNGKPSRPFIQAFHQFPYS